MMIMMTLALSRAFEELHRTGKKTSKKGFLIRPLLFHTKTGFGSFVLHHGSPRLIEGDRTSFTLFRRV